VKYRTTEHGSDKFSIPFQACRNELALTLQLLPDEMLQDREIETIACSIVYNVLQ
jgi:hypothetical protein